MGAWSPIGLVSMKPTLEGLFDGSPSSNPCGWYRDLRIVRGPKCMLTVVDPPIVSSGLAFSGGYTKAVVN